MQTIRAGQAGTGNARTFCTVLSKGFFLLLILPLWLVGSVSEAAQITFEPHGLTVAVAPGEVVSVPVSVTLADQTLQNSYASFSLNHVEGSLDSAWINSQVYLSLNSLKNTQQATLHVSPPADAKEGVYSAVFRTMWIRSNEIVSPADFVLKVEIGTQASCKQVPLFSAVESAEQAIHSRNNKPVTIELSGSVDATDGCEIAHAWYQLVDEYGELDQTAPVEINADGTFAASVPMVASRRGSDMDGRLYTVSFLAENEVGVGESAETRVVVSHDNRKP